MKYQVMEGNQILRDPSLNATISSDLEFLYLL